MKYDKYMDKECIALCDELNSLKGVKTFESCCGHYKKPYVIDMKISNWYSLSLLARAFDRRYSSGKFEIKVSSLDTPERKIGITCFSLITNIVPKNKKEMDEIIIEAIKSIKWWKQKRYIKHLKGTKKQKRFPKEELI